MIFAGHPRITIPPETCFLLDVVAEIPLTGRLDQAQVERAVELGGVYETGRVRWEASIESKLPGRQMDIHLRLFRCSTSP